MAPDSEKLREWVRSTGMNSSTGTFLQAAAYGDILVLATLGKAAEDAIDLVGKKNFGGKVLIDAATAEVRSCITPSANKILREAGNNLGKDLPPMLAKHKVKPEVMLHLDPGHKIIRVVEAPSAENVKDLERLGSRTYPVNEVNEEGGRALLASITAA